MPELEEASVDQTKNIFALEQVIVLLTTDYLLNRFALKQIIATYHPILNFS